MTSYGDHLPPGAHPRPGPGAPGPVAPGLAAPPPSGAPYSPPGPGPATSLMSAHRPGIIPLRPLSLGDILDGAVKAVRHNPKAMIGLSPPGQRDLPGSVGACCRCCSALASPTGWKRVRPGPSHHPAGTLSVAVFGQLATLVLTGLVVHAVGEAVLGRQAPRSAGCGEARAAGCCT